MLGWVIIDIMLDIHALIFLVNFCSIDVQSPNHLDLKAHSSLCLKLFYMLRNMILFPGIGSTAWDTSWYIFNRCSCWWCGSDGKRTCRTGITRLFSLEYAISNKQFYFFSYRFLQLIDVECAEDDEESICHRMVLVCGTSNCHMAISKTKLFIPGVWGPFWSGMF